jgi:cysteine protease ATG4
MNIYLPLDNAVIPSEIIALSRGWSCSVLIAIPLRLGTKHINPVYYPKLKAAFTLSTTVGIIGGRPKHALYLIGYADDVNFASFQPGGGEIPIQNLFGLDPHTTQEYRRLETVDAGDTHWDTFQTTTPAVMAINRMDPSCAMGFLVRSEHEYIEWRRAVVEVRLGSNQ